MYERTCESWAFTRTRTQLRVGVLGWHEAIHAIAHFPCHHVTWPSRLVIAMPLPTCLPSHLAMSIKCQLCKLVHTWTLHVWCVPIRPRVNCSGCFVVINNFQWWCGGYVVCVGVLSSSNLDDKWLISYSLAITNQSQVHNGGHVPNKWLIVQSFIQSLWYAMCLRVGGIWFNLD